MATTKLTMRAVNAAKASNRGDFYLFDSEVAGFGLRVKPTGAKSYVFQYRVGHGRAARKTRLVIGRPGSPWTVESARREAKRLGGLASTGKDPAAARRADENATLTVAALCKAYVEDMEAGRVLTKFNVPKAATTLTTDLARINRHIVPLIGQKRVQTLSRQDVERMLRDIAAGKTAIDEKSKKKRGRSRVTGGQGTASRTVGLLGGIFSYAVERGFCADNPVRGVKRYPDNKNERFLSPSELTQLGVSLAKAEEEGKDPFAIAAVRFLVLSGCRKSEVLTLQWEHVDQTHSCLRLPKSKTGAKIVPLGAAALSLLTKLPRIKGNPYVFPGKVSAQHYVGLPRFFEGIRSSAKLSGVRLHDLRHSFASAGAAGGLGLPLIGALLGHKDTKTTARYAHLADSPLKAAADRIAATVQAAMDATPVAEIRQFSAPHRKATRRAR
jgi:integrase